MFFFGFFIGIAVGVLICSFPSASRKQKRMDEYDKRYSKDYMNNPIVRNLNEYRDR